jgi:hypothetical protein
MLQIIGRWISRRSLGLFVYVYASDPVLFPAECATPWHCSPSAPSRHLCQRRVSSVGTPTTSPGAMSDDDARGPISATHSITRRCESKCRLDFLVNRRFSTPMLIHRNYPVFYSKMTFIFLCYAQELFHFHLLQFLPFRGPGHRFHGLSLQIHLFLFPLRGHLYPCQHHRAVHVPVGPFR